MIMKKTLVLAAALAAASANGEGAFTWVLLLRKGGACGALSREKTIEFRRRALRCSFAANPWKMDDRGVGSLFAIRAW